MSTLKKRPLRVWLLAGIILPCTACQLSLLKPPTMLFVLRHAEKTSDDADADLSAEGRRRAATLAWMLRDVPVDAVYATDYRRTRNTVQPLADEKRLAVLTYAGEAELADALLRHHRGQNVVVCGHSNTIPRLLDRLGTPIPQQVLEGFDDLFIVVRGGGAPALQHLHYR